VQADDDVTTTFFTARVDDARVQGVLDERCGADGRVLEATLYLRPYAALRAAITRLQTLLAEDPLPSTRNDASVPTANDRGAPR
jgi:hypothetical protein